MSECEYCANYYKCENAVSTDCFEEIRTLYDVLGNGLVLKTDDLDETARARMNWFFNFNYGFRFKEIGTAFEVQLGNSIHKSYKTTDIIVEMARNVYRCKTYPNWHKIIDWRCFDRIDIETDAGITEEQAKAIFFRLPATKDVLIAQIDYETDFDGEVTLYVYIENGNPDEWRQDTLDWTQKLTENGCENSLADENYGDYDVVIIYWGYFE